ARVDGQQRSRPAAPEGPAEGERHEPGLGVVAGDVDVQGMAVGPADGGGHARCAPAPMDPLAAVPRAVAGARIVDPDRNAVRAREALERAHVHGYAAPGRWKGPDHDERPHRDPPPAPSCSERVTPKCFFISSQKAWRARDEARSGRAGMPPTTAPGGTSCRTTALAPMMAPSPTTMGPRIFAPGETSTSSPIHGAPTYPDRPPMVTCWPMRQRAPIRVSGWRTTPRPP